MGTPAISVAVTACADSPALRRCLDRVGQQARSRGGEVLLAVNAPATDLASASRAALAGLAHRVLYEPEPGKSNALNAAVRAAAGPVIAFTDDDALPDLGWLEAITAPLLAGTDAPSGCGGPVLPVFPEGGPPSWLRHLMARTDSTFLGPYHFLGPRQLDYVESNLGARLPFGASCAFDREVLLSNPYSPRLGPNRRTGLRGGEDTELALRLLRAGHRLRYVPAARVYHPVARERMTWSFVRDRHHALGREVFLLLRELGDAEPGPAQLRRKVRRMRRASLRNLARSRRRRLRRTLRLATIEGALEECLGR